jgi:hypothetical protein
VRPTATAASPTTSAPTSPVRTTVVPMPMSHDDETAHKTRAAIPRLRDDLRANGRVYDVERPTTGSVIRDLPSRTTTSSWRSSAFGVEDAHAVAPVQRGHVDVPLLVARLVIS